MQIIFDNENEKNLFTQYGIVNTKVNMIHLFNYEHAADKKKFMIDMLESIVNFYNEREKKR